MSEWLDVLRRECEATSQPRVAARLRQPDGFPSPTVISQALNGKYPSERGLARLKALVEGIYLHHTVDCPVVGEIPTDQCQEYQALPFSNINRTRVAIFKACRSGCPHSNRMKEIEQ